MGKDHIPDSVKAENEHLKRLRAVEKNGRLQMKGRAHGYVLKLNEEVDILQKRIPKDVARLVEITGKPVDLQDKEKAEFLAIWKGNTLRWWRS